VPSSKKVFETTFKSYREISTIGQGGNGNVFKVVDDEGKNYAIKLLTENNTKKRKRFKNEIGFCQKNSHKHIVTVLDHGLFNVDGTMMPFYVMDIYSGSLKQLMAGGIPRDRILPYFVQMLDGVEAAHLQGVIHRDLKPENVLYLEQGTEPQLVIADFGISHFGEEQLATSIETNKNERLANYRYAAPEQREPNKAVDQRADIFALGLILNEMFTGDVPHGTNYKTVESVDAQFSYLDDLIAKMISQSPENRPKNIEEVKMILRARGNEFAERQKLSELKQQVIPAVELDDRLIVDAPHLVGATYENQRYSFTVSQELNSTWIRLFQNIRVTHPVSIGIHPQNFDFYEPTIISISIQEIFRTEISTADAVLMQNALKQWIKDTNQSYVEEIERQNQERKKQLILEKQREIKEQERRIEIQNALRANLLNPDI